MRDSNYMPYTVVRFLVLAVVVGLLVFGLSYAAGYKSYRLSRKDSQKQYHDNAALQERYEQDNDNYFDGNLPNIPVVWADIPADGKSHIMAQTRQDIYGNSTMIEIDTKTNIADVTRDLSLFHELCHVSTGRYVRSHNEDPHGPAFNACMHRLSDEHAFENLW